MRFAPVDGLRGIAAMMVVCTHIYLMAGQPPLGIVGKGFATLGCGVDLFFVLSGFCLYYPLTKPNARPSWGTFAYRRVRRIIPPYYAALGCVLLLPFLLRPLALAIGLPTMPIYPASFRQVWTHLLLVHTLFPDTMFTLDGPFWTLGVEAQFYVAFPLAVWLFHYWRWRGLVAIAIITLAYRLEVSYLMHQQLPTQYLTAGNGTVDVKVDLFLGRWVEFALGMFIALVVRGQPHLRITRRRELLFLGLAISLYLFAQFYLSGPPDRWLVPVPDACLAGTFAIVLLLACTKGTVTSAILSRPTIVWLGTISYSLYLVHFPIVTALAPSVQAPHLPGLLALLTATIAGVPLAVAAAAVFHALFERPFLIAPSDHTLKVESMSLLALAHE
jgi:peptidoglycan/LPS O-acetylase OafA/YrhL